MATPVTEYYPFSDGPGSAVTESQWRVMADRWLRSGIVAGYLDEFLVEASAPAAMSVVVNPGQARLNGHVGIQTTDVTLAIGAASGSARIDLVVLRADYTNNVVELAVKAGTPAVSPVAPVVTQNALLYEIALAQVAVSAGALSIGAGNVTDRRGFASSDVSIQWDKEWTIALPGLPSGAENFVMPWAVPVPAGWRRTLTAARHGTRNNQVEWTLRRSTTTIAAVPAGTAVTGFAAIVSGEAMVTASVSAPVVLADGDLIAPVPSNVESGADNWIVRLSGLLVYVGS